MDTLELLKRENTNQCINTIRPILYNMFAHDTSPFTLLIDHYYLSAIPNKDFLETDPAIRARYCKRNLAYISRLAKLGRRIRNVLIHRQVLEYKLFLDFTEQFLDFYSKPHGAELYVNMLLNNLINCYQELAEPSNQLHCLLCLQALTVSETKTYLETLQAERPLFNGNPENSITRPAKWFLKNGYRETIKGLEILIVEQKSKYFQKSGRFNSWNGDNFFCTLADFGRVALSIKLTITVFGIQETLPDQSKTLDNSNTLPDQPKTLPDQPKTLPDQSKTLPDQPKKVVITENSITAPLNWFKENGYQQKLKGLEIRIESGVYKDRLAILTGWNGTNAIFLIDEKNIKVAIRNTITVCNKIF